MSIETLERKLVIDELDSYELIREVEEIEKQKQLLVYLVGSVGAWDRIRDALMVLRSSNIAALLLFTQLEGLLTKEELEYLIAFLRDWDQLSLHNVLAVCGERIPAEYLELLRNEAKGELKHFREWLMASHDPRLHKYPGLPWRSFIRKIVAENYIFASNVGKWDVLEEPSEITRQVACFLDAKKRVVCFFPKRWSKLQ